MTQPSWLEIDLHRLDTNLNLIRSTVGPSVKICAVIKADAYGLGAVRLANRLVSQGVDTLAVYSPQQAEELGANNINASILVLGPMRNLDRNRELYRLAVSGKLHLSLHDPQQLDQVNRIGQQFGCKIPVHLYLDTGMSRSGFDPESASRTAHRMASLRHIHWAGLYTHLATAATDPDFTQQQTGTFDRFIDQHQEIIPSTTTLHLANTAATLRNPKHHRSMVRVGLGLLGYGDTPLDGQPATNQNQPLQPTLRWLSRLNHVKAFPKGSNVGYGCTHTLEKDSTLGIVPVGHADGYPLALSNKATVRVINAEQTTTTDAPVLGQVSMDQIIIDLTLAGQTPPPLGSTVELISNDPQSPRSLPALAKLAGSNCYEMLCRLSPRLQRKYTSSKTPIHTQHAPRKSRQPNLTTANTP